MTLSELQRAGTEWRKKPSLRYRDEERSSRTWNMYQAKCSLRLAVELAHIANVPLEDLAKDLADELK